MYALGTSVCQRNVKILFVFLFVHFLVRYDIYVKAIPYLVAIIINLPGEIHYLSGSYKRVTRRERR